jgi:hypothetical protein
MKAFAMMLAMAGSFATAAEAGTNLPALADYPAPNCVKVEMPSDVPPAKNGEDPVAYNKKIRQHNEQVVQYNVNLHQYTACMNDYVANAQADINLIRDKVNAAVAAGQTAN